MRVSGESEAMVRDLVHVHLQGHPESVRLAHVDAGFHAAIQAGIQTLAAVAETLRMEGNPAHVAATLVRETLPNLINDERLAEPDRAHLLGLYRLTTPRSQESVW